jgi:hypothetical protein
MLAAKAGMMAWALVPLQAPSGAGAAGTPGDMGSDWYESVHVVVEGEPITGLLVAMGNPG